MAGDGVVVYIYTIGGSDREVAEPMGRGVAVRGGWMHNRLWRGEVYKCVGITVVYLAAVSYSSVYVAVASRTC
jgi:hypothetical protein